MDIQEKPFIPENITLELKVNIMYTVIKRTIDIFGSLFLLLFLFPLLLIIACLIKVTDSKGNVIFIQERVGKNQTSFKMYKFRSMYTNAESQLNDLLKFNEVEGAMFKMKEDPRVTPIGKYIRAFSLDELPQLLNVLKGDMSLVGPRPPLIREVEEYSYSDKQRLLVKPGITGLWQVSGRNDLNFKDMVELDLEYIQSLSLKNDIRILLKTIRVVIKSDGAY